MTTTSTPFQIVIVGGGIAGLTAAIALRGPSRKIIVLEQSRLNKEIGAMISLQPNATKIVYKTWGLGKELSTSRSMVDQGFRVYSTEGELVNEVPLTTKTEYGASRVLWHRKDLHDALKRAVLSPSTVAGDLVEIRVSSRVVRCDPWGGVVTLESGEEIRGDIIIGADGIHSNLRKVVVEDGPTPMPTGLSAYRLMIPSNVLETEEKEFCDKIDPRAPFTSMVVAHDCRLIMGPGREGDVFGIVALVPDERMNEDPNATQSWVSEGKLDKLMETFSEFPRWITDIFKHSPDIGLWQLRDIEPLSTWHRGRLFLIGDAAHAMLPTQGQGASQAIEDSEALGAFFKEIMEPPSLEQITRLFADTFQSRYARASLIQGYSRQAARPGTVKQEKTVIMKPDEFMAFNSMYNGAKEWLRSERSLAGLA
ncbi:hypothetical protein AFLA_013030 [Aspergillus flavus NRRL3357]|nr:uncharacterized protein G4B84_011252 [Aspergillus flavus NRRL3357]KAF7629308.1 hypothetical protein AFLA_013030 [Aspergillus flavus NRRL3357]QMW35723.1 hypothetical protein G4B84_011252 [Aspergillus flavus NRRL3357]QMW47785.1 hypothetical protein G4B11_011303 [Aspergillus flavus]